MKKQIIALVCALTLSVGALPRASTSHRPLAGTPQENQLVEHGHYKNKSGQEVHSPAHSKDNEVPQGARAKCRDGSYSFSQHHSGTCSRHDGVATWE
jgi:hypothetical protein